MREYHKANEEYEIEIEKQKRINSILISIIDENKLISILTELYDLRKYKEELEKKNEPNRKAFNERMKIYMRKYSKKRKYKKNKKKYMKNYSKRYRQRLKEKKYGK